MVHFDYNTDKLFLYHEGEATVYTAPFTHEYTGFLMEAVIVRAPDMDPDRFERLVHLLSTVDPRFHYRVYMDKREAVFGVSRPHLYIFLHQIRPLV